MKNYIFGTGPFAIEVAKKLNHFGVTISGFLKLKEQNKPLPSSLYNNIPVLYIEDLNDQDSNIIITKKPMILADAIIYLKKNNYKNIYIVNEEVLQSSHSTMDELLYFFKKLDLTKPFLNYLETNIVDQCNLNCKGCAHFSNICSNKFVSIEQFKKDIENVSKKFYLYYFRLLGGEPLLHPNLKELITLSRQIFPDTIITIVTNGLLIESLSEEILKCMRDNNIILTISLYEPTSKILPNVLRKLQELNIKYLINDDYTKSPTIINEFETRLSTVKNGAGEKVSKICTGKFCHFLRDGKISKCFYPLLIDILNQKLETNFQLTENDYIDLEHLTDGWKAIEEMNKAIPFCDYCAEDVKKFAWEGYHKNDFDLNSFVVKK